jgi:lysophospholipase L1-like esterase
MPSENLRRFHQRITAKTTDNAARTVIIAALGDSVTAGAAAEDEYLHGQVYHAQLQRLLEKQYPLCVFSTINAGVNGQNAAGGLATLERDVLLLQTDLLLISFGLNDAHGGLEALDAYKTALQALLDRARSASAADIILLTPNMMAARDNDNIPARWRRDFERFVQLQTAGVLAAYAQAVREVGEANAVPVADVYAAWEALAARGIDTTAMLANGLNHPDERGHEIAARVLFDVILDEEKESDEA